tara:strand:- start:5714 stop:6145 length:432 start_codon:yes stop_codon:yes gene_type:complete
MIINMKMYELIDDIMIESIANMSDDELKNEIQLTVGELKDNSSLAIERLVQAIPQLKKARLIKARDNLEKARSKNTDISVAKCLIKSGKDAKALLIDMFMQNKLPEGLTVAFRDGKEVTDEEAEHILANLISIGAVNSDDQTS